MFSSDLQMNRVCRVFCGLAHQPQLWSDTGPTQAGIEVRDAKGGTLSHGEALLVGVAWEVYNGGAKDWAPLSAMLNTFDRKNMFALGGFLIAVAMNELDTWLESNAEAIAGKV